MSPDSAPVGWRTNWYTTLNRAPLQSAGLNRDLATASATACPKYTLAPDNSADKLPSNKTVISAVTLP